MTLRVQGGTRRRAGWELFLFACFYLKRQTFLPQVSRSEGKAIHSTSQETANNSLHAQNINKVTGAFPSSEEFMNCKLGIIVRICLRNPSVGFSLCGTVPKHTGREHPMPYIFLAPSLTTQYLASSPVLQFERNFTSSCGHRSMNPHWTLLMPRSSRISSADPGRALFLGWGRLTVSHRRLILSLIWDWMQSAFRGTFHCFLWDSFWRYPIYMVWFPIVPHPTSFLRGNLMQCGTEYQAATPRGMTSS